MLNFNNKLLKLIKLAIKLIQKLIFTINKIETTYKASQEKLENLSTSKIELTETLQKLEKLQSKLGAKTKTSEGEND